MLEKILSLFGLMPVVTQALLPIPWQHDQIKPRISFANLAQTRTSILGIANSLELPASESAQQDLIGKSITIAILGDSMIDTLGKDIPSLSKALINEFPTLKPKIYNYGVGSSTIEDGIKRITEEFEYQGKKYPPLYAQQPDIVVIESFAYNPFPDEPGSLDRHWLALAKAVDTIKKTLPNSAIVIATTIAPETTTFANGVPDLILSPTEKKKKTSLIKQYLKSTNRFARGEKLPLADAFSASIDDEGNGRLEYINKTDFLHPSEKGAELFAQILVKTLVENDLIPE